MRVYDIDVGGYERSDWKMRNEYMTELLIPIFSVIVGLIITFISTVHITNKNNKHKKATFITIAIGTLITTLSIPYLINELYIFGNKTGIGYTTSWDAKDVLSFYGSLLTFLGTVALGCLALCQNQKFKHENDIAQKRIENINTKLLKLDSSREKGKLFETIFHI